ncbi:MAG: transcription antitermination protein NusB [bacterium]|nr:transcription antitermination protein NusB [bacterium]
MDPRHTIRLHTVQNLFAISFSPDESKKVPPFKKNGLYLEVLKNESEVNKHISKHAPKFPLDRIARIDLCILQLALYELLILKKDPTKVIINEAIELAKELGNDRSFAFINAVLGSVVDEIELK